MALIRTASIVEIIQFAAAIVAFIAAVWQLVNVIHDTSAQAAAIDRRKTRTMLAQDRMMSEVARTGVVLTFLGIGLFSLILPPPGGPEHSAARELLQPMATRIGLLISTAILMLDGVRALRSRHTYDKILIEERLKRAEPVTVADLQSAAATVASAATAAEVAASRAAAAVETTDQKIDTLQGTATEIKGTVEEISAKVDPPTAK